MKQFKLLLLNHSFKKLKFFFTLGLLMIFGFSLNGQSCPCEGFGFQAKVGDGANNPTLSQVNSFDPTQPFTGCLLVFGQFTVDLNWDISGAEVIMMEGAEIVVDAIWMPLTLTIANTNIHGCDKLWKSITLQSQPPPNDWISSSLVLTNSTIRDGEYAINLPHTSARITITNNDFDANYVSIYSPPTGGNLKFIHQPQPIMGNTFQSTYNLFPHYNSNVNVGSTPYAGVEIHQNIFFNVGVQNGSSQNTFTGLRHGAIFRDSDFSLIGGVSISNLEGESIGVVSNNCTQTGVRNSTMTNLRIGVNGTNTGSVIFDNFMDVQNVGVSLNSCNERRNVILQNQIIAQSHGITASVISSNTNQQSLNIWNNEITAKIGMSLFRILSKATVENNIPITLVGDDNHSGNGIVLRQSKGDIRIQNNHINFTNVLAGFGGGIIIDDSETCQIIDNNITVANDNIASGMRVTNSPDNLFCCNSIDGAWVANYFVNNCDDTRYNTTMFGDNTYGLFMVQSIIGNQNNPGDDYAGGSLGIDAIFTGNQANMPLSQITTSAALMTNGLNNIVVPPGTMASDWFTLAGTDITCQSSPTCGETPYPQFGGNTGGETELTPNDVGISKLGDNPDMDGSLLKWESQRYLYKKLKHNSDLVSIDTDINSFFNQADNEKISNFYAVSNGINSLNVPPSSQSSVLSNLQNSIDDLSTSVASIEQELVTATGAEKLDLEQKRLDKIAELIPKLGDISAIRSQLKQQQKQKTEYLLAINQGLEPEYVFQVNEKIINQIFLETIGKDIYDFSEHQKKIINSIANQCITIGGKAVLHARALQQFYMTKFYEVDSGCGDNSNYRIGDTENQKIVIYPNPNFGAFSIQFEYPTEENLDLEFYDLNGRLLFEDKLYKGEFNYTFKDKNLESGVYILKLKSAVGNVLTRKVVVNKF